MPERTKAERRKISRLPCRIKRTSAIDGAVFPIAETEY